jgi:hypothetical protein
MRRFFGHGAVAYLVKFKVEKRVQKELRFDSCRDQTHQSREKPLHDSVGEYLEFLLPFNCEPPSPMHHTATA